MRQSAAEAIEASGVAVAFSAHADFPPILTLPTQSKPYFTAIHQEQNRVVGETSFHSYVTE